MNNMNNMNMPAPNMQGAPVPPPAPQAPAQPKLITDSMKRAMIYATASALFAALLGLVGALFLGAVEYQGVSFTIVNLVPNLFDIFDFFGNIGAAFDLMTIGAFFAMLLALIVTVMYLVAVILTIIALIKGIISFVKVFTAPDLTAKKSYMHTLLKGFSTVWFQLLSMFIFINNLVLGDDIDTAQMVVLILPGLVFVGANLMRKFTRDTFHTTTHTVMETVRDVLIFAAGATIFLVSDIDFLTTMINGLENALEAFDIMDGTLGILYIQYQTYFRMIIFYSMVFGVGLRILQQMSSDFHYAHPSRRGKVRGSAIVALVGSLVVFALDIIFPAWLEKPQVEVFSPEALELYLPVALVMIAALFVISWPVADDVTADELMLGSPLSKRAPTMAPLPRTAPPPVQTQAPYYAPQAQVAPPPVRQQAPYYAPQQPQYQAPQPQYQQPQYQAPQPQYQQPQYQQQYQAPQYQAPQYQQPQYQQPQNPWQTPQETAPVNDATEFVEVMNQENDEE